jgi:hypothetical protein
MLGMIKILHILALFWVKKRQFFAEFFGENILKIIISVPGVVEWGDWKLYEKYPWIQLRHIGR